tara:strand:+ start:41 stop:205 length:165 start_codon:yes stop_codon:yes gene_type:complete
MICQCGKELIWGGDHDYEDCGVEGEGIVSNLSCPNNECDVEVVYVHQNFSKENK